MKLLILTTLSLIFRVKSLDMDSANCRCTKATKFGKPFVVFWNSPTEGCHVNFQVHIELEKYGILTNSNQTWDGEVVTVFYNAQLGLYPYYRNDDKKLKYNGGLPQMVNLTKHLEKATQHITEKIPEFMYSGLAVIDWEGWRPLWEANFGAKRLYQTESIALLKNEGVLKKTGTIEKEARRRFNRAGKRLMIETIELGKRLRPRALWGFYGFPACRGNITTGYHCTNQSKIWNNKLSWLYKSSMALFPSIYLMDPHPDNGKFVAERLTEAFRISQMTASPGRDDLPVFPYLRPLYHFGARQFKMLSEDDLENAIGETVNHGSAGLILWGNHYDERTSREICLKYNEYVNDKLGPYITLLTEELETCSREKCHSNGRCVAQNFASRKLNGNTCKTTVHHGSVFKMNITPTELTQKTRHPLFQLNTTADALNAKPQKSKQKNMTETIKTLDKTNNSTKQEVEKTNTMKASKQYFANEINFKKSQKTHLTKPTASISRHMKTIKTKKTNSTTAKAVKIDGVQNILELFNSSPNSTNKKKEKSEPVWNKNAVLGFHKKNNVDTKNTIENGQEKVGGEKKFASEKDINRSDQEINVKKSENTTVEHNLQIVSKLKQGQKRSYSAQVSEETTVRVPGVYIILITVTLGGALLMTIIYVAIYYTVNVRGRSREQNYEYEYSDENPFSADSHSPWWNDEIDPCERLLKCKKDGN